MTRRTASTTTATDGQGDDGDTGDGEHLGDEMPGPPHHHGQDHGDEHAQAAAGAHVMLRVGSTCPRSRCLLRLDQAPVAACR